MQISDAFIHPTRLHKATGVLDEALRQKGVLEAMRIKQKGLDPVKNSNDGCYRTFLPNANSPVLSDICEQLVKAVSTVVSTMKVTATVTSMKAWLNVNSPNSANNIHAHHGALMAGVYYLDAENTGDLVMHSHATVNAMSPVHESWQNDHRFSPENNSMMLFPSWALHSVSINTADHDRICIGFNVY